MGMVDILLLNKTNEKNIYNIFVINKFVLSFFFFESYLNWFIFLLKIIL